MLGLAILIGIVATAVVFFVGFANGAKRGGAGSFGNDNIKTCAEACSNLVAKRNQTCAQKKATAAASAFADSCAKQLAAAALALAALAIAAGAAAGVPVIGPLLAAAVLIALAAQSLVVVYLTGQATGAGAALAVQSKALADDTQLEAEATTLVFQLCPPETANNCVASLPVC